MLYVGGHQHGQQCDVSVDAVMVSAIDEWAWPLTFRQERYIRQTYSLHGKWIDVLVWDKLKDFEALGIFAHMWERIRLEDRCEST